MRCWRSGSWAPVRQQQQLHTVMVIIKPTWLLIWLSILIKYYCAEEGTINLL